MMELAGERMTFREDADGTATFQFDDTGTGRQCGACQLCCKLVPVPPIRKAAGVRCQHARHAKGCTIYPTRPEACRLWSCRWLVVPATAGMPRPDRCHYVIDLDYDYVTKVPYDGSPSTQSPVLQVWVDPAFPNAHRAPELRAYMLRTAELYGAATIVRYNSRRALTVVPPPLTGDDAWRELSDLTIEARNGEEQAILDDFV